MSPINITFFQRKPYDFHFSIEKLFDVIRNNLPTNFQWTIHISPFYSQGLFPRLKNLVAAKKAQSRINHVTGDIYYIALSLNRHKTIITYHDLNFMSHPNPLARLILKYFWVILPVKHSTYVTAISESTKDEILKYVPSAKNKIVVIPNIIHSNFKYIPKTFNDATPCILQIGTKYNKNLERLIDALNGISCKLHIIGKLTDNQIKRLTDTHINWSNAYEITEEELIRSYADCDILCFCSTMEGFGLPILEAQTTGRVVITSNCSSMPEVAQDGACLVDPYDVESMRKGILKVISDQSYRENLIKKGLENCKRYNPTVIADQYSQLYNKLIAQKHDWSKQNTHHLSLFHSGTTSRRHR